MCHTFKVWHIYTIFKLTKGYGLIVSVLSSTFTGNIRALIADGLYFEKKRNAIQVIALNGYRCTFHKPGERD
jgi:hypothetical protein